MAEKVQKIWVEEEEDFKRKEGEREKRTDRQTKRANSNERDTFFPAEQERWRMAAIFDDNWSKQKAIRSW